MRSRERLYKDIIVNSHIMVGFAVKVWTVGVSITVCCGR